MERSTRRRAKSALAAMTILATGATAGVLASRIHVSFDDNPAKAGPPSAMQPSMPPPTASQLDAARAVSRTFVQVAEQLKPSVVAIFVTKGGGEAHHEGMREQQQNPFRGTPFEHFFQFPFGNGDEGPAPKEYGAGSGVVIDSRGYILTNNHVVDGANDIKVKFADGSEVKATVAGTDPKTDLAVVKVDRKGLVAAPLGDSDKLEPGEWVIAIGNPFGFDHTVTVGVISAKGRYGVGDGPYEDFLQTDAAINPGNSGGPLVNLDGQVVGINTAIKGIGTMIGFAIPSNMAKPVATQLIRTGHVHRPYLGILMQDVTPELQKGLGSNAPRRGAIVSQVEKESPASRTGLQPGDVIVAVDGKPVNSSKAVQRDVLAKAVGDRISIEVWRSGHDVKLSGVTGESPDDKDKMPASGHEEDHGHARLGMELQTLTPELADRLGINEEHGAVIAGLRPDSPAADAGLKEGDVIVEVDRKRVKTAQEARAALTQKRGGGHLVRVKRGDGAAYVVVPSP